VQPSIRYLLSLPSENMERTKKVSNAQNYRTGKLIIRYTINIQELKHTIMTTAQLGKKSKMNDPDIILHDSCSSCNDSSQKATGQQDKNNSNNIFCEPYKKLSGKRWETLYNRHNFPKRVQILQSISLSINEDKIRELQDIKKAKRDQLRDNSVLLFSRNEKEQSNVNNSSEEEDKSLQKQTNDKRIQYWKGRNQSSLQTYRELNMECSRLIEEDLKCKASSTMYNDHHIFLTRELRKLECSNREILMLSEKISDTISSLEPPMQDNMRLQKMSLLKDGFGGSFRRNKKPRQLSCNPAA